jgi:hypothetical protein
VREKIVDLHFNNVIALLSFDRFLRHIAVAKVDG